MQDFAKPLGDAVKRARLEMELSQKELARNVHVDVRTIINIENYTGNPTMEILFPLLRYLKIDVREIFFPEMQRSTPALSQLRQFVEDCSESDAAAILPVLQSFLIAVYNQRAKPI